MASRFHLSQTAQRFEIAFDDGGMNLLSGDALRELGAAFAACASSGLPLLLFRSAQPRLFAAGADMAEMQRFTADDAYEFAALGQEVFASIERLPMSTVAWIDGDCFGGALDLILAFDFRLATPRSRFAHPGARIGIVTGFGGTSRWRKVLTRPAAHQLFLANRTFTAGEALEMGLIDGVADSHDAGLARLAELDAATMRMVKMLTSDQPLSRLELLRLARG